ncbi:ester cyclase [Marivita sp. S6314]|uniref:nuclear transport factor 2 family protein n=1 Tax=Marivita sp. S6314 TaxID=2926406 RepID=UPI001FF2B16D|nr:ester cyclase [Marivita sp. S6314]MCK0149672.1 ester cyclase [Marivita sp. S6314]
MKGFDPRFRDFPDFILGCTKDIWEDRGLHTLHQYYADDIVLRMPLGIYRGNAGVIAKTMGTLVEFPDRELLGEDVIWSGTPEDGMLSSHRVYTTGTHLGPGPFGDPTGKRITFRAIADCYAKDNTISDEWLVRDYGGVVRQMGWSPRDAAARLIAQEGGQERASRPFTPAQNIDGPYNGRGNTSDWGEHYAETLSRIMAADFTVIPETYDRAIAAEYPGLTSVRGWAEVDAFWLGLRAAFPNATFRIDHMIGREDPSMPPRAALRWSLHGRHDGWGAFGAPTGADVYVMGMAHAEYGALVASDPRIRREFVLYDEVAVWKQILLHTG